MKLITVRHEQLKVNDLSHRVSSHIRAFDDQYVVRVFSHDGAEIVSTCAPTRGEALVDLSKYLREMSKELSNMALEQEGALGMTLELAGASPR